MEEERCCSPMNYSVEGIATIDDRGQMVIPKHVRQAAGIEPGDRLAIAIGKRDGRVCCLQLIKITEIDRKVGEMV
ncbi:MAG: AbrB/MazE/SpoVT family DNA-binding domain-containing protein [Euryarchaeota archaeon]|nr:AbrB/MazE/SpoVT family DNA-binding domain-containing protein [Euryarchaeota archaeon]